MVDEKKLHDFTGQMLGDLGGASAIVILNAVLATLQRSDLGASAKLNDILEAALAHRVAEIASKL